MRKTFVKFITCIFILHPFPKLMIYLNISIFPKIACREMRKEENTIVTTFNIVLTYSKLLLCTVLSTL